MQDARRRFTREDPASRRADLIGATLQLVADKGPAFATVRAIADAAGLSPGMIRHYFVSKEDLLNAAYDAHMEAQIAATEAALEAEGTATERLARFVSASLLPPVLDPRAMSIWAGFIHMIRRDARMRATHEANYLRFRDRMEALIRDALAETDRTMSHARALAIACNAVIDGLWLEGGALPDAFDQDELRQIGLASVGALLGIDLDKMTETR